MTGPYIDFLAEEARWCAMYRDKVFTPLLAAMADQVDRMWDEAMEKSKHPDVKPWFHTTTEPGPYTEDPEDGYPYDE